MDACLKKGFVQKLVSHRFVQATRAFATLWLDGRATRLFGANSISGRRHVISEHCKWWGGKCLQCRVCGETAAFEKGATVEQEQERPHAWRCQKHVDRNPCVIEGCKRSTDARGNLEVDGWMCGEHWRRYVPPRSRARRLYHAHFRRAKKHGWTADNRRSFWRYWERLVSRARAHATEGHLDVNEINKLMGWDDAAE